MIFKLTPRVDHKEGDIRKIRSFCWLPTRVKDDIIWMEHVIITQKYHEYRMCIVSFVIEEDWWENISYEVERTE